MTGKPFLLQFKLLTGFVYCTVKQESSFLAQKKNSLSLQQKNGQAIIYLMWAVISYYTLLKMSS